jgi:hypothetical protein
MSALGQKRTFRSAIGMSASPSKSGHYARLEEHRVRGNILGYSITFSGRVRYGFLITSATVFDGDTSTI